MSMDNYLGKEIGIQEFVGAFTVFAFLLWLRIADDLKDYQTDLTLFPERPLPSGRVKKKDIMVICVIVQAITLALRTDAAMSAPAPPRAPRYTAPFAVMASLTACERFPLPRPRTSVSPE